jgi:hypothetical protein
VLAINAVLVQDYQNGSRQIFFTHEAEPHPLSPSFPYYQSMMDNILRLLINKVMVKSVESKYACYKQGETVNIKSEIASFEMDDKNIEITLQVFDGVKEVFRHSDLIKILAKSTLQKQWEWSPNKFDNDEYTIKLTVRKDKKVISVAENGFVVWNNDIALKGPSVEIKNEYFKIGSTETFISGTNYYESTRGEVMWFRPDVKKIIEDIKQMRSNGINTTHYFHSTKNLKILKILSQTKEHGESLICSFTYVRNIILFTAATCLLLFRLRWATHVDGLEPPKLFMILINERHKKIF